MCESYDIGLSSDVELLVDVFKVVNVNDFCVFHQTRSTRLCDGGEQVRLKMYFKHNNFENVGGLISPIGIYCELEQSV